MTVRAFPRYKNYKKADSAWLDEVPSHWVAGRIKDFVNHDTSTKLPENFSGDDLIEFVPMTNVNEELGEIAKFNLVPLKDVSSGYTKFRNKDVIFAKLTPCMENGNCAIVSGLRYNIGFGSTEFLVFRATRKLIENYLHYFLHNELFRRNAQHFMKGTAGQKRISNHYMITHFFCLPPLSEQKVIADYLDTKTVQIDNKIELLEQKAEKYADLKQSLINETVTRGLNKTAPMKDSGVEWIGQIPAHWEMKRLKDIANIQNSNVDKKSHEHEVSVRLCNYVDVYKNEYIDSSLNFMKATADEFEIRRFSIRKNDVLITKDSETFDDIAVPALAIETLEDVICGYHLAQIRTNQRILSGAYLFRLFQSQRYGFRFMVNAKGITRVGLGQSAIADALTPIPPLNEQEAIVELLKSKTSHIEKIIGTIYLEIEKLKELRNTLINDVVTGKIKVIGRP